MKFLIADTSSSVCGVGVFDDDRCLSKNELDNGRTHSENFMPLIEKSLSEAGLKLDDIECLGVVTGPGSFTGIRIGVASCKAMAEVAGIKMVSAISLDSLAANGVGEASVICSLIDARNDQVYCGIFDGDVNRLEDYLADDTNVVLDVLKKYDDIVFVGDGSVVHHDLICESFKDKKISFCENNKQNVDSLWKIVNKKAKAGDFTDVDELIPVYLRKSQAERNK